MFLLLKLLSCNSHSWPQGGDEHILAFPFQYTAQRCHPVQLNRLTSALSPTHTWPQPITGVLPLLDKDHKYKKH